MREAFPTLDFEQRPSERERASFSQRKTGTDPKTDLP